MATEVQVKKQGKLKTYLRGVRTESKKVVWPTFKQLMSYTGVVIAVSVFVSLIVYALDFLIGYVYRLVL